jgi:hypothetical protein
VHRLDPLPDWRQDLFDPRLHTHTLRNVRVACVAAQCQTWHRRTTTWWRVDGDVAVWWQSGGVVAW